MEGTVKRKQFSKQVHTVMHGKQGRIHGKTVADGWAGAVMQKPLAIQKSLLLTYRPTDIPTYRLTDLPTDTARCRVACPRLKMDEQF